MTDRTHPDSGRTTGGIVEMLQDRVAELEAQLEAIGAGGVSPLIGQQASDSFSAADMATAAAQGFRDGVAADHDKRCPAAWDTSVKCNCGAQAVDEIALIEKALEIVGITSLLNHGAASCVFTEGCAGVSQEHLLAYTREIALHCAVALAHPSPPEGMVGGWIALPGALPEPGTPVLLDIGKKYPIRAMWAAKHTVQAADDDTDWGEYVEADDMYYAPEGWYEWNECEDNHWRVTETPRAWAPLPPTTSAGSGKGE